MHQPKSSGAAVKEGMPAQTLQPEKGVNGHRFQFNERVLPLLDEFKTLKENWDEEGALPPSPAVIRRAEELVRSLQITGQKIFHVAPGPNGEIMVDLRENEKSIEILFYPNKARFVQFPAVGQPTTGDFNDDQLPKILKWLND
ncbi:MAG: hypothetical protein ACKVUS_10535 [Saprospiraceae bacterium]